MSGPGGDDIGTHGAARPVDHPVLGPLPAAAAVPFTFEGREVVGRAGEPVAAALLAAGVRVLRTMPRGGEARGPSCMVGRCADCLVTFDGVPGVRACLEPVRAGIAVAAQRGLGGWGDGAGEPFAPPDDDGPDASPMGTLIEGPR